MGPHPGSPTHYPSTRKTETAKLPGGGRKARSTRHDTLYAGALSLKEDHLKGSAEERMGNHYGKRGDTDNAWPLFRGRGWANTFYR